MVGDDFYRGQRPFLPQFPLSDMTAHTHQSVHTLFFKHLNFERLSPGFSLHRRNWKVVTGRVAVQQRPVGCDPRKSPQKPELGSTGPSAGGPQVFAW